MLLGPLLGGALLSAFSPSAVLAVDASTFFVADATVMQAPPGSQSRRRGWSARGFWSSVTEGLSYARGSAGLRALLVILSVWTVAYSGLFAVGLPAFARASGHGPFALRALIACSGLGQLSGALCAAITGLPHRWGYLIIGMALGEGLAFVAIGIAASSWAFSRPPTFASPSTLLACSC
jgi:Transmembrane secretion effector